MDQRQLVVVLLKPGPAFKSMTGEEGHDSVLTQQSKLGSLLTGGLVAFPAAQRTLMRLPACREGQLWKKREFL